MSGDLLPGRGRRGRPRLHLERSGPWIGVAGMFVVLWLAISSVLFAPWWGVVLNLLLLLPEGLCLSAAIRTHPRRSPVVPLVGAMLYVLLAVAGALWWGWHL